MFIKCEMNNGLDKKTITVMLKKIEWKFVPPDASYVTGIWKKLVRSVSTTLQGLLKRRQRNYLVMKVCIHYCAKLNVYLTTGLSR